MSTSTAQPNTSLYVKNLNTKTKKPELRRLLYVLFNSYGKVLDVVATRADGMRGQAFIVFRDLQSATSAMRALDGFEFYEKRLSVSYARSKSHATIVHEQGPEALFNPDAMAKNNSGKVKTAPIGKVTYSSAQGVPKDTRQKRARGEDEEESDDEERDSDEDGEPVAKVPRLEGNAPQAEEAEAEKNDEPMERQEEEDGDAMEMDDSDDEATATAAASKKDDVVEIEKEEAVKSASPPPQESGPEVTGPPSAEIGMVPNNLLFCDKLPKDVTEEALTALFTQYKGFESVQLVKGRGRKLNHAFVEFADAAQAGVALEGLTGFQLTPKVKLTVGWAKRG